MPGPAWDDDPPGALAQIHANLRQLLIGLLENASARVPPSIELAAGWHRAIYAGIAVPSASYLGIPRDSDPEHPDLVDYEVQVGRKRGVPAAEVPSALVALERALVAAVSSFDAVLPVGSAPTDPPTIHAVVQLAAIAHGEWVRIHPYANGNGRTARLWANWVAMRYGLPPFVQLKPRPAGMLYARAAAASMGMPPDFVGDHGPMAAVFVDLLHQARGT